MSLPASDQPTLFSDPEQDAAWLRRQLLQRGWAPGRVTEPNTLSMARHFPGRRQALAAWESIAAGKTYRPGE